MSDERRTSPRRGLPLGRSAILRVDATDHIVALADLSRGGAQLAARLEISDEASLALKLFLPQGRGEAVLPCELVRRIPADETTQTPAGFAVRFVDLDEQQINQLETFVSAPQPSNRGPVGQVG